MDQPLLFKGISRESIEAMEHCFKPETRFFRRGGTILVYSSELKYLCVLIKGSAHLYCMDSDGEYTLLEHYSPNDIFGEVFAMPYGELGYAVEADSDCEVMFIRFSCICGRCEKACQHHSQLTKNLFELSAKKAQSLAMRINIISKKSLRRKLWTYFEYMRDKTGLESFSLDISLSQLAGFICADRTSMMRELKNMCDEGIISRRGRQVRLLQKSLP
ncbi:MAG: Crp/Fnr family transcriptional regulator [Candidatus Limivicinus sp.]|jgi:CRP-like cAMP-binding protein